MLIPLLCLPPKSLLIWYVLYVLGSFRLSAVGPQCTLGLNKMYTRLKTSPRTSLLDVLICIISILYPLRIFVANLVFVIKIGMRFDCICACDLTVIHILYHFSFDVSPPEISLFPCSIILHRAAPHDSTGFLFQTEMIKFNF